MKKIISALSIALLLLSCGEPKSGNRSISRNDDNATDTIDDIEAQIQAEEYSDYTTYYMAVADTGINYYKLDEKMYDLSIMLNFPIDTMGRHYDRRKDNIILSDTDEDEMYRGEYYPRRGPDEHLSLEYLSFFDTSASAKTIVLLAGIYEHQHSADSMVTLLKKHSPTAYTLKGRVYIGCMH